MPKDYSPFTPGQPIAPELFVGRQAEIDRLRGMVGNAASGRLQVAFLSGERGIGKSSLASFIRHLAESGHDMLGLHTFLGGVSSLAEMVRRIFDRLVKDSIDRTWQQKIKAFFGEHIKQVGLFGVSVQLAADSRDLDRMVHDFAPALSKLCRELRDQKKGIVLILDDINGLAVSVPFANWLKSLVDEIATGREPLPLCLILVGRSENRQSLVARQPSLARVFDLIEISAWSKDEARDFYTSTFHSADVDVDEKALAPLVEYAGGLPVLAHEIGDAAFRSDDDNYIDVDDALAGVLTAADIVGRKHLEPRVSDAIRSKTYRSILREIAKESVGFEFKRSEVLTQLKEGQKKVFDNFLSRMTELGVLVRDTEKGAGFYHFANRLHYTYFWLAARRTQGPRHA